MFKILLQKDLKLAFKSWPRILFSAILYSLLLVSIFIIIPEFANAEKLESLVYLISIISFLGQSIFINISKDEDYQANMIGYFYKLNHGLFTFVASKFCAMLIIYIIQLAALFMILLAFSNLALDQIVGVALALFLYSTIVNLMLLFANNLMIDNSYGYYSLIILPFVIPYMMLCISSVFEWGYLVLFCGIILIKIPIVLGLISLALARL